MSFSSDTKAELCRGKIEKRCCAVAEACGELLFGSAYTPKLVKISTVSEEVSSRLPRVFKRAFGFEPQFTASGVRMVMEITDDKQLKKIFDECGGDKDRTVTHHVNYGLLEEEHDRQSFLRGAFLTGGSVNDPRKHYHLELVTHHHSACRETVSLLREMGFDPGETERNGSYIIYFKNSEAISEFLTTIGAPVAGMEIISAKIEKSIAGQVNRRLNCDGANIDKTVDAAQRQLDAIATLRERGELEELGDKLRETARAREENPELSLQQLAETFKPPVSKSSLSYRLRRLCELAEGEEN